MSADVAEEHAGETVYRLRVRPHDRTEPTFVLYVSQPAARGVPHDVGQTISLDPRLLSQE